MQENDLDKMKRKEFISIVFLLVVIIVIFFCVLYRGAEAFEVDAFSLKNIVFTALFVIIVPIIYYLMKKKGD